MDDKSKNFFNFRKWKKVTNQKTECGKNGCTINEHGAQIKNRIKRFNFHKIITKRPLVQIAANLHYRSPEDDVFFNFWSLKCGVLIGYGEINLRIAK